MLLRDRPLLQDRIDARIFMARPHLEDPILRHLKQERNVLLVGPPGSGKTTLMRRIQAGLAETGRRTIWMNAGLADNAQHLLGEIETAFRELDGGDDRPGDDEETPSGLLTIVRAISAHRPATILVDGLLDEEIGFDLFGRLRDELWAAGHVWLVAVSAQRSATLRVPPAEAFWSTAVEIPPLTVSEVAELLERGLDAEERNLVKRNSPISGVHLRQLIREVERIIEEEEEEGTGVVPRIGALTEAAAGLGRSEVMAMTELIGLGRAASVHDPELLERLGWSRAYAQRIFASLEAAHLVRSIPESNRDRGGRPRKLYEPNNGYPG